MPNILDEGDLVSETGVYPVVLILPERGNTFSFSVNEPFTDLLIVKGQFIVFDIDKNRAAIGIDKAQDRTLVDMANNLQAARL